METESSDWGIRSASKAPVNPQSGVGQWPESCVIKAGLPCRSLPRSFLLVRHQHCRRDLSPLVDFPFPFCIQTCRIDTLIFYPCLNNLALSIFNGPKMTFPTPLGTALQGRTSQFGFWLTLVFLFHIFLTSKYYKNRHGSFNSESWNLSKYRWLTGSMQASECRSRSGLSPCGVGLPLQQLQLGSD